MGAGDLAAVLGGGGVGALLMAAPKSCDYMRTNEYREKARLAQIARSDWGEKLIAEITKLWAEGHSTAEIGRRMGFSKSAIIGKAHRLQLPARQSPIQKGVVGPRKPRPSRAGRSTLPPLSVVTEGKRLKATGALIGPTLPVGPPMPFPPTIFKPLPSTACCYPMGDPKAQDFRFCGKPAPAGKPYCVACHAICYVPIRDRREDGYVVNAHASALPVRDAA